LHCAQGPRTSLDRVLRLLDSRTGSYAEVRPARPGLLRVRVHAPGGSHITGLRVLLMADLLGRTAELRGLQVLNVLTYTGRSSEQAAALERAAGELGVHPPAARADPDDAQTPLGGPVDVHVVSSGTSVDGGQGGIVWHVGAVHARQEGNRAEAGAGDVPARHGHDPLAVRLALMSFPSGQAVDLTEGVLTGAREELGRWRHEVAEWAESPSRPMPARIAEVAHAAFDGLDTVSALALLRRLESDASVPPGAKFETFAYADRILGVDLARDIGRARG